jgi:hypothetical protein
MSASITMKVDAAKPAGILMRLLNASVYGYYSSLRYASVSMTSGLVGGIILGMSVSATESAATVNPTEEQNARLRLRPFFFACLGTLGGAVFGWALGYITGFARSWEKSGGAYYKGVILGIIAKSLPSTPPLTFAWWLLRDVDVSN